MKVGSLFSGIGGLDLGLERAGMEVVWQVEIDEWCRRVLAKHWPDVPRHGDIRELAGDELEGVDLICGGFPCQPVSVAGQRRGTEDPRWLWPEMARLICILRPRYVLVENVPGLFHRGFGDVLGDLAASGYDAEWNCLPAAALGAPHLRDRVFILAHAQPNALRNESEPEQGGSGEAIPEDDGATRSMAHANSRRRRGWEDHEGQTSPERGRAEDGGQAVADSAGLRPPHSREGEAWSQLAGRHSLTRCGWWDIEPDVGRVADGVSGRVDRLRGLGNAVVPQVAEWIGRRIMTVEAS